METFDHGSFHVNCDWFKCSCLYNNHHLDRLDLIRRECLDDIKQREEKATCL